MRALWTLTAMALSGCSAILGLDDAQIDRTEPASIAPPVVSIVPGDAARDTLEASAPHDTSPMMAPDAPPDTTPADATALDTATPAVDAHGE